MLTPDVAANLTSPVRGQWINLVLQDTMVAANYLVPVLREGAEPKALDATCHAMQGRARDRA